MLVPIMFSLSIILSSLKINTPFGLKQVRLVLILVCARDIMGLVSVHFETGTKKIKQHTISGVLTIVSHYKDKKVEDMTYAD